MTDEEFAEFAKTMAEGFKKMIAEVNKLTALIQKSGDRR